MCSISLILNCFSLPCLSNMYNCNATQHNTCPTNFNIASQLKSIDEILLSPYGLLHFVPPLNAREPIWNIFSKPAKCVIQNLNTIISIWPFALSPLSMLENPFETFFQNLPNAWFKILTLLSPYGLLRCPPSQCSRTHLKHFFKTCQMRDSKS
mgnify:CR=1 FL=1